MPESVFDYGAINAQMKGDDWYAPKRDMIETAREAQQREPDQCEACDPAPCQTTAPTPPIPCGQAAASRPGQGLLPRSHAEQGQQLRLKNVPPPGVIGEYKGVQVREVPDLEDLKAQNLALVDSAVQQLQCNPALISDRPESRAVHMLVSTIEQNICEETHKLHERVARLRSMIWRGGPREENERIKEEEARYQLLTAPMRRQRDWLLQQLVNVLPPPVMVAPYDSHEGAFVNDYHCEPVREIDMRTHKRR